jgi:FkbM family methyltransferase
MVIRKAQRVGLWLYRNINRSGLLGTRPAKRIFNLVYFAYKRHLEDPFQNLANRHPELFKGGHVIDVGANIGYTASVFARALDAGFRVWAFEPSSANFSQLETTVADQHLELLITPIHAAVGERVGLIDLRINETHPGDHRVDDDGVGGLAGAPIEKVQLTSIDEAVRAHRIAPIAFIKVDVQGYELSVCRGMTITLAANPRAVVVVEYSPLSLRALGADPHDLALFFTLRGYRAYRLTQRGALESVDPSALPTDLPPPGYIDLLFTPAFHEVRE